MHSAGNDYGGVFVSTHGQLNLLAAFLCSLQTYIWGRTLNAFSFIVCVFIKKKIKLNKNRKSNKTSILPHET